MADDQPNVTLNDEDLKALRNRITRARRYSLQEVTAADKGRLRVMQEMHEGAWIATNEEEEGADKIVANYSMPNIEIKVASVTTGEPQFTFEDHPAVPPPVMRQAEEGFRRYWRSIDASIATRAAFRTSKVAPIGLCTYNWSDTHQQIRLREVWPTNFWIDPEATSLDDAEFVVERQVLPFREVIADERYKVPPDLKPTHVPRDLDASDEQTKKITSTADSEHGTDTAVALLHYWGYHPDVHEDIGLMHIVLAEMPASSQAYSEPLLAEPTPYPFQRYPYRAIVANPRLRQFYGMSDLRLTEDQQQLINHTTSAVSTRARRAGVDKLIADQTSLAGDTEWRAKLESASAEVLLADLEGRKPADVVAAIESPPLQQENLLARELAVEDMSVIMGVTDYHRGRFPETKRLATEVVEMSQKAGLRGEFDQLMYEKFLADLAEDIFAYTRTAHPEPLGLGYEADMWQEWSPAELPPSIRIEVLPGSTAMADKDRDMQRLMLVWNAFQPLFQQGALQWQPLIRQILNLIDIPDVDAMMAQPPPQVGQPPMIGAPEMGAPEMGGPTYTMGGGMMGGPIAQTPPIPMWPPTTEEAE